MSMKNFCAEPIHSILADYNALLRAWEEALQAIQNTKVKARIQGVAVQMTTFTYLLILDQGVLREYCLHPHSNKIMHNMLCWGYNVH